jgi:hypothetical protein
MVIARLQWLVQQHGDRDVYLDTNPEALQSIGEIDLDLEDTGFIFWPRDEDECPFLEAT